MTWTYVQPWATGCDYVRYLIQDTDTANQIFQDEELDSLLTNNSSDPRLAAAEALEALASKYARGAIVYSVTGFSMNRTHVVDALLTRAGRLRDAAAQVPFEFESVLDYYVDEQGIDRSNYPTTPIDPGMPLP